MIIPEKAFGLLTEKEQQYLKKQKLEVFVCGRWIHENKEINENYTYREKPRYINNLRELQDLTQQFLSDEYPFMAMDKDECIYLYPRKPDVMDIQFDNGGYPLKIIIPKNIIINKNINWKETLSSLYPMED